MKPTIRLFKAVAVKCKKKKANKKLMEETIKSGFIISPEVVYNYTDTELVRLVKIANKEFGLSAKQANSSFHKSWKKIKEASIEQLVIEQLVHYFTTYGFEGLGIYSQDSIYIPPEKLEIPELEEGIRLIVIKGYTKEELKEKLLKMLQSGVALKDETVNDVVDVALYLDLSDKDIEGIRNKETKTALYDYLGIFPENPIEFLRYVVYKATDNSLLIKDKATIEAIKEKKNLDVLNLFKKYKVRYGLENIAEIFYRFKPLFLAFRTNSQLRTLINRIRKLAPRHHKPAKTDYINSVTATLKRGWEIKSKDLKAELKKVNIFRKIRLAYALKYRADGADSIVYRVRNGKGYATDFDFVRGHEAVRCYKIVVDSIVESLSKSIKGKRVYIPDHITYALPSTEKQFTGFFPSGSYVSVPKDMIFGVHWEDVDGRGIDLDLSLINSDVGKIGWDSGYRTEDRSILFSGDITRAPKPNGASELFYIKRQKMSSFIFIVNYYNYDSSVDVPYKIMVGNGQPKRFCKNYMIDPNNVLATSGSTINQRQKVLGIVVTTTNECRFYFAETSMGKSITSSGSPFVEHARKYFFSFYKNAVSLNEILKKSGALMVGKDEKCDIDLSPENIEKDTIISLLSTTLSPPTGSKKKAEEKK